MPTSPLSVVIQHLRADFGPDGDGVTDGELLARFVRSRDEDALADLVQRHASMVWGVCCRLLRNQHDAEDAFQATFLVLVRKAADVPRQAVANWLYGVARLTAVRLRATAAKRRRRESQVVNMPEPAVAEVRDTDWQSVLDEELSRLPDHYRGVVVLCDLECMTRREAARQLGIPDGSVASRLARARAMLARRLARRGVVFSGGSVLTLLSAGASSSAPPVLVASTIKAASLLAAGPAAGVVSVPVAALTEGVVKAMFVSKLKAVLSVVLILGFVATGAAFMTFNTAAGQEGKKPAAEPKVKAPPEPERDLPGVRPNLAGTWQGDDWGTVVLRPAKDGGFEGTYSSTFGKETGRIVVRWSAASRQYEGTWSEGTYRFGRIALDAPKDGAVAGAYTTDPKCEHQPGMPSLASLKWNKKQEKDEAKEAYTAWGKEVGGLQAGLGFRPGEKRGYRHGETVALVVRVRNVGKETVKFSFLQPFVEHTLSVTDADGKAVLQPVVITDIGERLPGEVELPPGKETELHVLKRQLSPASESSKKGKLPYPLAGMGKVSVQYEQVLGTPSMGVPGWKLDPALSKLATGKLELEVEFDQPPPAEKKDPQKQGKEAYTAWGKEVDGLQAGLGFRPGERRIYRHGETVAVVVRVRNVGKEAVNLKYLKEFFSENAPSVTGGEGRPVLGLRTFITDKAPVPVDVNLAPGTEIEMCELVLALRPLTEVEPSVGRAGSQHTLQASGKVNIQYERVLGDTASVQNKIDPQLKKLATGKLELDVKGAENGGETR